MIYLSSRGVKNFLFQNKQFLLYCVIGLGGTLLDLAVFTGLRQANVFKYEVANAISYASGTMLSFVLNVWFNFRVTDRIAQRLVCFFGVALLGWSVSAGLLYVLVARFNCNEYIAKMITLVVIVALQYNLNRWISFRKSD
jgi:putative flippase GtrA